MMNMENILETVELDQVNGGGMGIVNDGHSIVIRQLQSANEYWRLKEKAEKEKLHGPLEAIEAAEAEARAKHTEHATKNIYRNIIRG